MISILPSCSALWYRNERYKLIHFYYDIDQWELYDHEQDPNELNNLYISKKESKLVSKLKSELYDLKKYYGNELTYEMRKFLILILMDQNLRKQAMKVLVTGGLGYIGSHTALNIKELYLVIADNLINSKIEVLDRINSISHSKVVLKKLMKNKKANLSFLKAWRYFRIIHMRQLLERVLKNHFCIMIIILIHY